MASTFNIPYHSPEALLSRQERPCVINNQIVVLFVFHRKLCLNQKPKNKKRKKESSNYGSGGIL